MEEKILTPEQVAQILQVHPFTVLKFIKQGKLHASKLGRVYRIRNSDLEYFLDSTSGRTEKKTINSELIPKTKTKNSLENNPSSTKNNALEKHSVKIDQVISTETTQVNQAEGGLDHYYILD